MGRELRVAIVYNSAIFLAVAAAATTVSSGLPPAPKDVPAELLTARSVALTESENESPTR